ncbi:hypothetical protein OF122_05920 [Pelagibacterium flavum]|uniref:Secreted protein n=1 Tax=Pelagibacterium flavum TaxID=2984530 RepID=A0ABY6IRU8_9HYPH|nr:hypothetical protein [Pelagibacterium sp. YIM 151497]MAN76673.1 hypothetical protein [Hyphomicrobiales bacterium]UYQ73298.1 hypothetical protein OF122_05920 [Pelagibacterium sp. YIM 151497]|tara:strand:+ start:503 stop:706 length:204 start_codon:yes stop_codon:yes gene_type:complete
MSAFRIAKTVAFLALAASRSPVVRSAVKAAPKLVSKERKQAAYEATKRAARKAGEVTARVVPPNRYF